MAEQIVIAELQLNTKSLENSNAKLIQDIAKLKEEQKNLSKETANLTNATEEQSLAYIENDARLKALNTEYANNKKVLAESTAGVAGLNDLLSQEAKKVGDAEIANRKLSIIRSQITTDTQAGRDAISEINKKINENNNFIQENSDKLKQQKMNVGNYKEAISSAFQDLNLFNGGLGGFIQRSQEAGGAGNLVKNSFTGIKDGVIGATKASLGFIATPLGAVIAAIALVLVGLVNIFRTFTPIVDKAEQVTAAIGATFNVVKNSVIALVTGAKSLTEVFSGLGSAMSNAAEDAASLTKAQQDLDDALAQQEVTSAKTRAEINRLNIQAKDRTKTEEERLALLEKASKLEEQDFQERKKNSDEQLRIAQEQIRISAQLTDAEFEQLQKQGLKYKEVTEGKATNQDELYNKLKEALLKSTDIENEYYSNQEKNINKQNKLIEDEQAAREKATADALKAKEEAAKKEQELQDKTLERMNDELSLFVAIENTKQKTIEESLRFEEEASKKRLEILEKEYAFGKISKTKYEEQKLLIEVETRKRQAELAVENLEKEAELYKLNNQSRLDNAKTLTEFLVQEESNRIETIYSNEFEINEKRKADGLISEQDYEIKKKELSNNFAQEKNSLQLAYDEQLRNERALQEQVDYETKLIELDGRNATAFERELERIAFEEEEKTRLLQEIEAPIKEQKLADLEAELEQKLAKDEADLAYMSSYNDRKFEINKDYEQKLSNVIVESEIARDKIRVAAQNAKLIGAAQVANGVAQLAGKETAVGKAAAIASTTITTYQSAVSAFNAMSGIPIVGPVLGGVAAAAAIASGLISVGKIVGVNTGEGADALSGIASGIGQVGQASLPKAEKGALFKIGGRRHSAGGTKFYGEDGTAFEAEKDELIGVMNRNAASAFMDFNNQYASGGIVTRNNVFADGGIVQRANSIALPQQATIDYDRLGEAMAGAVSQLPPPQVAVTDINTGQDSYAQVVDGANIL